MLAVVMRTRTSYNILVSVYLPCKGFPPLKHVQPAGTVQSVTRKHGIFVAKAQLGISFLGLQHARGCWLESYGGHEQLQLTLQTRTCPTPYVCDVHLREVFNICTINSFHAGISIILVAAKEDTFREADIEVSAMLCCLCTVLDHWQCSIKSQAQLPAACCNQLSNSVDAPGT